MMKTPPSELASMLLLYSWAIFRSPTAHCFVAVFILLICPFCR